MEQNKTRKRIEYKFRVSPQLHDYISSYAAENGLKKAEAVREICIEKFAEFYDNPNIKDVPRI